MGFRSQLSALEAGRHAVSAGIQEAFCRADLPTGEAFEPLGNKEKAVRMPGRGFDPSSL